MGRRTSTSIMALSYIMMLDFPLDWNEKVTFFLILFSAGLLCVLCALLLAVYLLKSDRFVDKPKEEAPLTYPSFDEFEEESRLSRLKSKIASFFGGIKRRFKRSKEEPEFLESESLKTTEDFPSDSPEKEPDSTEEPSEN